jgi:hypothetical protein
MITSLKCATKTRISFQTPRHAISMCGQRMSVRVAAKTEEREPSTSSSSSGGSEEPNDFWEVSKDYIHKLIFDRFLHSST